MNRALMVNGQGIGYRKGVTPQQPGKNDNEICIAVVRLLAPPFIDPNFPIFLWFFSTCQLVLTNLTTIMLRL